MRLLWQTEGVPKQVIPTSALLPADSTTPPEIRDSDGDGLPDYWKFAHGLDPFSGEGGEAPFGQNGKSHRDAFLSGAGPYGWSNRQVRMRWAAPLVRTDGKPMAQEELAGYRLRIDSDTGYHSWTLDIPEPKRRELVLQGLAPEYNWFLSVRAYDRQGREGPPARHRLPASEMEPQPIRIRPDR
ncbi:hypothetical protein CAI21_07425 [Alkalilimnicola ehrlichii]|uniref:Uncharacterized protein n=1 Tax=Alkalilimnicola ehrlichii TaxID=351052 RepID=A0A3E0WYW9_9GAMM|nr:hypothetical protein [Alkalilimnicola ehrlichii]RFA30037.1 hypothetical protein CAI21_07425 [Alkalilimnicola ehrlichii]RFA37381.1 hypothetical protein CAL65_08760 [Alkalilimnicola ehrlichii]